MDISHLAAAPTGVAALDPTSPSAARLRDLVALATRAPSSHNTQPWRFHALDDETIELRADRSRALPVVDPDDRALVISCGAALGTLRAAIRAAGFAGEVERLPEAHDPDLLARVRLGEPMDPTRVDLARADAIPRRHTNRRAFAAREVPLTVLGILQHVAWMEGAWLRAVIDGDEKTAVADLVAAGDCLQAEDPAFRRELAAWMHPNRTTSRDGMPGSAFGVGDLMSLPFPWIIRTFDWGDGQAAKDRQLATGSPALLVLGTDEDSPGAWLRTGEALALLLLDATAAGLSASFLNQPVEVAELRPLLAHRLELHGMPQLVLRLGYGEPVPPTPRRAVEEVLEL